MRKAYAKKLSILGKQEKEVSSKGYIDESLENVEEDLDPDLEILRKKPKLKSHSERISEKYEKE